MANLLVCKQCGHENESERVYCHNCGAKLDRSLLPDESVKAGEQKAQQRRVRKLTNPARGFFVGWFGSLVMTLLWAALAASAIQIFRPPDDVPPEPKKGELVEPSRLISQIEEGLALQTPQKLVLNATLINTYLQRIGSKSTGLLADYVKFDRAFVNLREDDFRMTAQQSAFDYKFYAAIDYSLSIENGKVSAKILGGSMGRLPIHPKLMAYAEDVVFQKFWDELRREHKLVDGMGSIEVHKNQFVMVTKAAAPLAR